MKNTWKYWERNRNVIEEEKNKMHYSQKDYNAFFIILINIQIFL